MIFTAMLLPGQWSIQKIINLKISYAQCFHSEAAIHRCSIKKLFWKIFAIQRKTAVLSSLFNKVTVYCLQSATLFKKIQRQINFPAFQAALIAYNFLYKQTVYKHLALGT